MNKNNNINMITKVAILAGLASSIGIIDRIISGLILSFIPGIKIGFANIIILLSIIQLDFKQSLLISILKSIIVGLIFGGITSFLIGAPSTLLSYIIMYILYNKIKNKLHIISISVIGGLIHINTQLVIISLIYDIGKEIYVYGIILILISFITSIIIGYIVNKINNMHKAHNLDI